jgi:predicted molibdopterin-dependent oxidoreductase YjgC
MDRAEFRFGDETVPCRDGDTIGAALWRAGRRELRRSPRLGAPRGMFCAIGTCFECLVSADGAIVRACVTPARAGMQVERLAPEPPA